MRSGTTHVGTWTPERRDVSADCRRIFGEESLPVEGIAISTSTAQTDEEITSYYGDLVFRRAASDSATLNTTCTSTRFDRLVRSTGIPTGFLNASVRTLPDNVLSRM